MTPSHRRPIRSEQAGFTLVELMITVAIVSILAAVSLPALSHYIMRSRTVEATGFLSEIKARQESYRFDFGQYCDVSATSETFFPSNTPTADIQTWSDAALTTAPNDNWLILGAVPPGRTSRFVYSTVAGGPGGASPSGRGFDSDRGYTNPSTDFWFISSALGDLDGDGTFMRIESYSHTKDLWSSVGDGID